MKHNPQPSPRHLSRRELLAALAAAGAVLALLAGAAFGLQYWQARAYETRPTLADSAPAPETARFYQGVRYLPREQLECYLFMGIDEDGPVRSNKSYIGGGQADVQLLLVVDHEARTWQLLALNRDTMAEIPVLGPLGNEIGTEFQQLALAHTYGEGLQDSCRNNLTAVSRLLGGQRIHRYLSLNMDAIPILNDLAGGVTVTLESDLSALDPALTSGSTVTLTGQQAVQFLRSRRGVEDETNLARMERQRLYLGALSQALMDKDPQLILDGYNAVWDYMVTDLPSGEAADLVQQLRQYEELPTLTIEGENRIDSNGFVAYELDPDSLEQTILQLFYQPA